MRAELTAEIKASARRQLAVDGAAGLSLRAIARELGMASSAIYRYFASREELLTALIIDAYDSAGAQVEEADRGRPRDDFEGRFIAIARAFRGWAMANPHEYALIYGSPVPGYAAPEDTIDPATRIPVALLAVLIDANATKRPAASAGDPPGAAADDLNNALADLLDFSGHQVPASTLAKGVASWAELSGLVSLELFGHFNNAVTDPEAFFEHAMAAVAKRILIDF